MKNPEREILDETGFGDAEIDGDFDFSEIVDGLDKGWEEGVDTTVKSDQYEPGLSAIFYEDDLAADEDLAPWEPVGWDDNQLPSPDALTTPLCPGFLCPLR
jgi:hypothetical protein